MPGAHSPTRHGGEECSIGYMNTYEHYIYIPIPPSPTTLPFMNLDVESINVIKEIVLM